MRLLAKGLSDKQVAGLATRMNLAMNPNDGSSDITFNFLMNGNDLAVGSG